MEDMGQGEIETDLCVGLSFGLFVCGRVKGWRWRKSGRNGWLVIVEKLRAVIEVVCAPEIAVAVGNCYVNRTVSSMRGGSLRQTWWSI